MPEKRPNILKRWMDSTNPKDDVTLAGFLAVVAFGILALAMDWWHAKAISANWVQAFGILATLVGLGGAGRAAVDKWRNGAQQQTTGAGAPDQDGGAA